VAANPFEVAIELVNQIGRLLIQREVGEVAAGEYARDEHNLSRVEGEHYISRPVGEDAAWGR